MNYYATPNKSSKLKIGDSTKCRRRRRETVSLVRCWRECETVQQPLWKIVWQVLWVFFFFWKTEYICHTTQQLPPRHLSERNENSSCTKTCTRLFIATSPAVVRSRKQPKCLSVGIWWGKLVIRATEHYSEIRGHELLTHTTTRISRASHWVRDQSQKVTKHDSIYVVFSKWRNCRDLVLVGRGKCDCDGGPRGRALWRWDSADGIIRW